MMAQTEGMKVLWTVLAIVAAFLAYDYLVKPGAAWVMAQFKK